MRASKDLRKLACATAGMNLVRLCSSSQPSAESHPALETFSLPPKRQQEPPGLAMARADSAAYVSSLYLHSFYEEAVILTHVALIRKFLVATEGKLTKSLLFKLVPTSLQVAAKWHTDFYYGNARLAKVSGIVPRELNHLELEFLETLQWELSVSHEEYLFVQRFMTHSPVSEMNACKPTAPTARHCKRVRPRRRDVNSVVGKWQKQLPCAS